MIFVIRKWGCGPERSRPARERRGKAGRQRGGRASLISACELREKLEYCPETGEFRWRKRPEDDGNDRFFNRTFAGKVAGGTDKLGYCKITIGDRKYLAHRLAWLYVYGVWPKHDIDHIDHRPSNNRLDNLRPATRSQNRANSILSTRNTSGLKGVSRDKKKWRATIKSNGKWRHLGSFDTKEEAAGAYARAARLLHGEFAYTGGA